MSGTNIYNESFADSTIGMDCAVEFDIEPSCWPIPGYPAWCHIHAVDMPMVKIGHMGSSAEGFWINVNKIVRVWGIRPPRKL